MPCCSEDVDPAGEEEGTHTKRQEVDSLHIHNQYFTVTVAFLKDIISESAKVCFLQNYSVSVS